MTAQPASRLLTAEEFFNLDDPPDGGKMELRGGVVVTCMPVSGEHGRSALAIGSALRAFARPAGLGTSFVKTGFILRRAPDHVLSPDVSFLALDRTPPGGIPAAGFIPGAPTLAVEVVSPEDRDAQINDKVEDYLAAGTRRVWVVRPKRKSVTVHHPDGTARTLTGDSALSSDDAGFAIEGFSLPLSDIFAD